MKKLYSKSKIIALALFLSFSGLMSGQVIVTLGAGTTAGSGTTAGPINEYYRSLHCQIVYTAAELNAAGVCGGVINKLGFYINTGVTNPLPNYTIKMKGTSATNVATYDGTGLTTVYNLASYNPVAGGFDMLTLTTPFIWNGTDNILIDVCFDQVSAYTSTGTVRNYSPTVANGFIYVRSDSAPQCGVACSTTSSNKPQIQFEFASAAATDLGVSKILKPAFNKCFGNDTLVATIKNFGTAPIDFSTTPGLITVQTTGAVNNTYTLALSSGSLASCGSQTYTLTTNYSTASLGTYYIKAFTTVAGDGFAANDTLKTTTVRNPFFSKTFTPNDSVCRLEAVQLNANYTNPGSQVGAGSIVNSSTGYPSPYGQFYGGAKHQFLYLASELTAAGVTPGNIEGIKFNVTNLNSVAALTGYNVSIATTTLTAITSLQTTGFTTYFSAASYVTLLGANTHTFSTPFVWDGVSNIIIETCFNNNNSGSSNASVSQSTTPFTSSIWFRADNNPAVCSSTTSTSSMSQRPNTWFVQPVVVNYTWTPAIGLSATNIPNPMATLSSSNTYTVSADLNGCMTYDTVRVFIKPTPVPALGIDTLLCTVPYILNSNTAADTYTWSSGAHTTSVSVNSAGVYWVKATGPTGCVGYDTINITIGNKPIVTLGPDTAFCQGKTITLYAGNNPGTYLWNTGATTKTLSVGTTGTYSVTVTDPSTCKTSDVVNVTSKPNPTVSLVFTGTTVFCPNQSGRALTEGLPSGGTYIGSGVSGTAPSQVFNANTAGQGTYIILYNYTAANGCNSLASDTLRVENCGVGIEELTEDLGLNVYPNPNTGLFTIEINAASEIEGKVVIMAIDSRIVLENSIAGNGLITKEVNIADLANGIYYLRLETKNAARTFKILKQ